MTSKKWRKLGPWEAAIKRETLLITNALQTTIIIEFELLKLQTKKSSFNPAIRILIVFVSGSTQFMRKKKLSPMYFKPLAYFFAWQSFERVTSSTPVLQETTSFLWHWVTATVGIWAHLSSIKRLYFQWHIQIFLSFRHTLTYFHTL